MPETLISALAELEKEYEAAIKDPAFQVRYPRFPWPGWQECS